MRMSSEHRPEKEERGIEPTHSAISGRVVSGGLWTLPQIGTDERKMKGERERRGKKKRKRRGERTAESAKVQNCVPKNSLIW